MCRNKILGAAITTALSMGANTVVQAAAGDLTMQGTINSTMNVAYELFPDSTAPLPNGTTFKVQYETSKDFNDDFYATFTLTSGGWSAGLASNALVHNGGSNASVALVENGEAEDSTATFLVSGNVALGDGLTFDFNLVDVDNTLENEGGKIEMDANFAIAANPTKEAQATPDRLTLIEAEKGVEVSIDADSTIGTVAIDVAQASKGFVGGLTDTMVHLCSFTLDNGSGVKDTDGTTAFDFGTDLTTATATLTITNGIFSASLDSSGAFDTEKVFIDYDCLGGTFDSSTGDVAATTLTADVATWEIDTDPLNSGSYPLNAGVGTERCIAVVADGTTAIQANDNPPEAVLSIDFGSQTKSFPGNCRHVQPNGTICWLSNLPVVPTPALLAANPSLDKAFIRVMNLSTAREGSLTGTLRKDDGSVIAADLDLLPFAVPAPLTTIASQTTAVISGAKIFEHFDTDPNDSSDDPWKRRATLEVTSNLQSGEIEILLLLRAGNGPLMSYSTGAQGNSCQ